MANNRIRLCEYNEISIYKILDIEYCDKKVRERKYNHRSENSPSSIPHYR